MAAVSYQVIEDARLLPLLSDSVTLYYSRLKSVQQSKPAFYESVLDLLKKNYCQSIKSLFTSFACYQPVEFPP